MAEIIRHYSPFGSLISNRSWSDASRVYRYGFNGKEKDFETSADKYDFGARIYDGRLGRWLSLDPLMKKYTDQSPYDFCLNSVLIFKDFDGRDVILTILKPKRTDKDVDCFNDIGSTGLVGNTVTFVLNTKTGLYDLVATVETIYARNLRNLEKINPGITIFAKVHEGVHISRYRKAIYSNYGLNSEFLKSTFGCADVFSGTADQVLNSFIKKAKELIDINVNENNSKIDKEYESRIAEAEKSGNLSEVERLKKEKEEKKQSYANSLNEKFEEEKKIFIDKLTECVNSDVEQFNSHDDYNIDGETYDGVNTETTQILDALGETNASYIQNGKPVYQAIVNNGIVTKGNQILVCPKKE